MVSILFTASSFVLFSLKHIIVICAIFMLHPKWCAQPQVCAVTRCNSLSIRRQPLQFHVARGARISMGTMPDVCAGGVQQNFRSAVHTKLKGRGSCAHCEKNANCVADARRRCVNVACAYTGGLWRGARRRGIVWQKKWKVHSRIYVRSAHKHILQHNNSTVNQVID